MKPTIRLKAPREGETIVNDHVQGRVAFPNKDLDDLIILRSDGNPTYNLAVVVDDHDMEVTHVIRGADHLTNSARQTQIYQGMGWTVPEFAHVPLIHGADGAKLSKRHGAQGVEEYRDMGYLPVALRNYLVRLGWSHGDDEIISTDDLLRWFDIDGINKSPARLDFKKLDDLNGHYIRASGDEELEAHVRGMLPHLNFQALVELPSDPKALKTSRHRTGARSVAPASCCFDGQGTRGSFRRQGMGKIHGGHSVPQRALEDSRGTPWRSTIHRCGAAAQTRG